VTLPSASAQELRDCLYGIGASKQECGVLGRMHSGGGQSLGWPARAQDGDSWQQCVHPERGGGHLSRESARGPHADGPLNASCSKEPRETNPG